MADSLPTDGLSIIQWVVGIAAGLGVPIGWVYKRMATFDKRLSDIAEQARKESQAGDDEIREAIRLGQESASNFRENVLKMMATKADLERLDDRQEKRASESEIRLTDLIRSQHRNPRS